MFETNNPHQLLMVQSISLQLLLLISIAEHFVSCKESMYIPEGVIITSMIIRLKVCLQNICCLSHQCVLITIVATIVMTSVLINRRNIWYASSICVRQAID